MFIEINSNSINYHGERICGDTFAQRYIPNQRRTVAVLSDGMGHGTKANILSNLTVSIILNMGQAKETILKTANTILQTLPVCSVRGISYSTFTILDIDHVSSLVRILEFDNPQALIFRGETPLSLERHSQTIVNEDVQINTQRSTLYISEFIARRGDRVVICSDGVTQSGLGSDKYPFGWGLPSFSAFVHDTISSDPTINSHELSLRVLSKALQKDGGHSKDDITCGVFTFRESRRLMLCSCPPSSTNSAGLAQHVVGAPYPTIVCGYELAQIVATELDLEITRNATSTDPDLPPLWFADGIGLITEGFLTLNKVLDILVNYHERPIGRGPAYRIVKMIMASDHIQMVIGTKESQMGSQFIDNYHIRRQMLERIAVILERKFEKAVTKSYI
ncbi:MAG: SpoIIE family protein phosphatase [Rikenellaceae bacterium]